MSVKYQAYWIDPYGSIIPLTANRHIHEIINNPEKFNLTTKEIAAVYKRKKERIGSEGEAREEIMFNLIKNGWGRIRYINQKDSFIIQVFNLNHQQKENIYDWAHLAIKKGGASKFTEVTINEIKRNGNTLNGIIEDILKYKIFNESLTVKPKKSQAFTFIENYIKR
jgi:hypothetical protein